MNKDRKEAKPKERGKAWRGRKRKEVKPLEEQRFKPGGPIAQGGRCVMITACRPSTLPWPLNGILKRMGV